MKTAKMVTPKIKKGSIFIIFGLFGLTLSISTIENHFILSAVCVLIEFVGVGIIVKERLRNNERNKLLIPVISIGLICVILITYLMILEAHNTR